MVRACTLVLFGLAFFAVVASTMAQDCASLNYCSSHGQCRDGACVCHDGYGSEDCSLPTTGCSSFCSAHGTCLNGTCSCDSGFGGETCNLVVQSCPNNCSGHGMCNQGSCICFPGLWTGDACEIEVYRCPQDLNDCTGHGTCGPVDWENQTSAWVCTCDSGFCGDACNLVCGHCPNNCSGHGVCHSGECACLVGYGGSDCAHVAAIDSCPNNCSGNGLCQQTNGSYHCACSDCFSGADCSVSGVFCPGNCSARGHCSCDGKCSCQPGYSGEACQDVDSTCSELAFCTGNGQCKNGTCKCNAGFAGSTCSLACHTGGVGTVGCGADRLRGRCVSVDDINATCQCMPEFTGVGCQLNTTSGMLDEYVNGWNPIGTMVLLCVGVAVAAFVGAFAFNYVQGKRGMSALPGIDSLRSKVKGADYEGQRNESVY